MATLKRDYIPFYLDGRDERPLRTNIDMEALAEKAIGSGDIHSTLRAAVEGAAKPLEHDRKRREWAEEFDEQIKDAGGDVSEAYHHYIGGRIDETIAKLEPELVDAISEVFDDDSGGDRDDDDEDEDDGGE